MKRFTWWLLATAALATCTWVVAWWMVPVVGAIYGYVRRDDAATPLLAGIGGMVAWGVLMVIAASGAPAGSVMEAVGAAMRVGPGALVGLTLAFPALLAAAASGMVRAVAGTRG